MGIKHTFHSAKADGIDPTLVQPSNWNDDHTVNGNVTMLTYRHTNVGDAAAPTDYASAKQVIAGALQYIPTVGGTVDAILLTSSVAPTSYTAGQRIVFVAAGTNTGAVTTNRDGLGAKALKTMAGADLAAGALTSGRIVDAIYNGTYFMWLNGPPVSVDAATLTGTLPAISGANLTNLNANNLGSGTVAAARGGAGTINGIMKANGSGVVSVAVAGTDYAPATSGSALLYGNGSGGFSGVTIGSNLTFAGGTLSAASAPVSSVAGKTGAVSLVPGDISGFNASASSAAPVQSVAGKTGTVSLVPGDISGFNASAAAAAPVSSVAGKTGAVSLTRTDIGSVGTMAARDVTLSTSGPSGGSSGDVWFKYT